MDMQNITNSLRGIRNYRAEEHIFPLLILAFTALNTWRLFTEFLPGLGWVIALVAIGLQDYGFLYWGRRRELSARNHTQKWIAQVARWSSMAAALTNSAIDLLLHQTLWPVDRYQITVSGYEMTLAAGLGLLAGGIFMVLLAVHSGAVVLYSDADSEMQLSIEQRLAENANIERQLAVQKARNTVQGNMTADAIEELMKRYADNRSLAAQIGAEMIPDILEDWTGRTMQRPTHSLPAPAQTTPAPAPVPTPPTPEPTMKPGVMPDPTHAHGLNGTGAKNGYQNGKG
jgi:hypothetical protein